MPTTQFKRPCAHAAAHTMTEGIWPSSCVTNLSCSHTACSRGSDMASSPAGESAPASALRICMCAPCAALTLACAIPTSIIPDQLSKRNAMHPGMGKAACRRLSARRCQASRIESARHQSTTDVASLLLAQARAKGIGGCCNTLGSPSSLAQTPQTVTSKIMVLRMKNLAGNVPHVFRIMQPPPVAPSPASWSRRPS